MKGIILSFFLLVASCQPQKDKKPTTTSKDEVLHSEVIVIKVASQQVDCEGAHSSQKCLQIKEVLAKKWEITYDGIVGFTFEPGFVYKLQVKKEQLKNPPADASAIRYTLLEVIEKEKDIPIDTSKLPVLTVTKIENGKDGYTASLKDSKGGAYTCTISIPNLEDNYIRLKVGDQVKIAGEYAESDPVQIFAKKLFKIN